MAKLYERFCHCELPDRKHGPAPDKCGKCYGKLPPYPTEAELNRETWQFISWLMLFTLLALAAAIGGALWR